MRYHGKLPYPLAMILLYFVFSSAAALSCMQCGGKIFEGDIRISRHHCCNATRVECKKGQACLRAYVVSSETKFFLSGCHATEDDLIGCDRHHVMANVTIDQCTCMDEQCQSHFPGYCHGPVSATPKTTVAHKETTKATKISPRLQAPWSQARQEWNEQINNTFIQTFSLLLLVILVFLQ